MLEDTSKWSPFSLRIDVRLSYDYRHAANALLFPSGSWYVLEL